MLYCHGVSLHSPMVHTQLTNFLNMKKIVFTTGRYLNTFFEMLAGQALKVTFKPKSKLLKFPGITIQHKLDLFNTFFLPIHVLYHGVKVWGLNEGIQSCTFLQTIF